MCPDPSVQGSTPPPQNGMLRTTTDSECGDERKYSRSPSLAGYLDTVCGLKKVGTPQFIILFGEHTRSPKMETLNPPAVTKHLSWVSLTFCQFLTF